MTRLDATLLKEKIDHSGYKLQFIAQETGITYQCFLNKLNGKTEFKATEIKKLYDLLELNPKQLEEIFFTPIVD